MITLKPCPFCGEDRLDVQTDELWAMQNHVPYAFVVCPSCGTRGPIAQRGCGTELQCRVAAALKWEARKVVG